MAKIEEAKNSSNIHKLVIGKFGYILGSGKEAEYCDRLRDCLFFIMIFGLFTLN